MKQIQIHLFILKVRKCDTETISFTPAIDQSIQQLTNDRKNSLLLGTPTYESFLCSEVPGSIQCQNVFFLLTLALAGTTCIDKLGVKSLQTSCSQCTGCFSNGCGL